MDKDPLPPSSEKENELQSLRATAQSLETSLTSRRASHRADEFVVTIREETLRLKQVNDRITALVGVNPK
jgi:hypothetical protein